MVMAIEVSECDESSIRQMELWSVKVVMSSLCLSEMRIWPHPPQ